MTTRGKDGLFPSECGEPYSLCSKAQGNLQKVVISGKLRVVNEEEEAKRKIAEEAKVEELAKKRAARIALMQGKQ
jgi:hypothetical protein